MGWLGAALLLILLTGQEIWSYRIIGLVNMPAKSHALLFDRLMIELANRGHDVTHVTTFPTKKKIPNFREITLPDAKKMFASDMKMNMFEMRHMTPLHNMIILPMMGMKLCDAILEQQQIKDLLNEKFDIIIGEGFMSESLLAAFSHRTGGKIIAYGTFMPNIWVNYMVGNPAPSSYIPDPFMGYDTKMNFKERLYNFLFGVLYEAYHTLYYLPRQDEIFRRHIGEDVPPLKEIIKNTSLVLVNHHYSLAFPRAYLPNMIEIGGIHVGPLKPLPKDLQTFMDNAKEGVILFSLGSNLQSADLPPEKIQAILNAFSKMKHQVIWKFEAEELPNKPKNVMISKWLPQSDILGHPNLKLFITHGGLLSTTEAVMRGVPVVGIPVFGDQPINMRHTERVGFGKALAFDDLTEEALVSTVNEVLSNPKYREIAQERSKLLQDTPVKPLDKAVYWVEYVAKYKGAPHLKSASQDLKWWQFYLLDVYLVIGVGTLAGLFVQYHLIKCAYNMCCRRKSKTDITKKKN